MLFNFDVIELFGEGICVLDNRLTPILVEHASPDKNSSGKAASSPRRGRHDTVRRERLYNVIDKMGEASAKAQGLHASITGGHRLAQSDHHLYVMVDRKSNRDRGSVVGILKIGRKTLFVYDRQNRQKEMYPLCVLDFYVHESRQRTGCGKKLFDCMLRRERISPEHLAIDRPSHKFSSFLRKHYNLRAVIPQVNNFVVFEGFFVNRADDSMKRVGTSVSRLPAYPSPNKVPRPFSHYDRTTQSPYAEHTHLVNEVDPHRGKPASRDHLSDFSRLEIKRNDHDASERLQPEGKQIPRPEVPAPEVERASYRTELASHRACAPEVNVYGCQVPGISTPEPDKSPGMSRPRDGPSHDYRDFVSHLNQHHTYQDRRGRLVVSESARNDVPAVNHASNPSQPISIHRDGRSSNQSPAHQARSLPASQNFNSWRDQSPTSNVADQSERCKPSKDQLVSWTVFGTPPNYNGRKWQHTKLW